MCGFKKRKENHASTLHSADKMEQQIHLVVKEFLIVIHPLMLKHLLNSFLILLLLAGCQKESDVNPYQKTKSALLGKWNLVSYEYQEYKSDDSPGLYFSGTTTDSTAETLEFTDTEMIFIHVKEDARFSWPYRITSDTTLLFIVDKDGERNVTIEELTATKFVTTTRFPLSSTRNFGRVVVNKVYNR